MQLQALFTYQSLTFKVSTEQSACLTDLTDLITLTENVCYKWSVDEDGPFCHRLLQELPAVCELRELSGVDVEAATDLVCETLQTAALPLRVAISLTHARGARNPTTLVG